MLISPGPGRPEDAGLSNEVIRHFAGSRPVFGVCLGHQCIGQVFGGDVVRAPEVMHGKTSLIRHHDLGVFEGLPNPLEATRYHSLVVDRASVPDVLEITAETDDGMVMGLRHRELDVEGVQFHPESILTASGHDLMRNFLRRRRPAASDRHAVAVAPIRAGRPVVVVELVLRGRRARGRGSTSVVVGAGPVDTMIVTVEPSSA